MENKEHYTKELAVNGMVIRTTNKPSTEVYSQTFYVSSQTDSEKEYIIKTRLNTTRGVPLGGYGNEFICSCSDFIFREWSQHEDCKHIKAVEALVNLFGAPSLLANKLRQL